MTENQSLTSKIIKILRVANEPLSVNAINRLYKISKKRTKEVLAELEEDNLIYSIKTNRGKFYFLPDKYFKREKDYLDSDELPPIVWYEDLSNVELATRKRKIIDQITNIKELFAEKEITSSDFFKKLQEKNEELSIINQILEERVSKRTICFYCKKNLNEKHCFHCKKEQPICSVCRDSIYGNEEMAVCPHCKKMAHDHHFREWLEKTSTCPYCKKKIKKDLEITILEAQIRVKN